MIRRLALILIGLAVLAGGRVPAALGATPPWVSTRANEFVDARTGSPVLLRGVDVSAGADPAVQQLVAGMGANLVRIHVGWDQLEPAAPSGSTRHWNSALLSSMQQQVAWYAAHGVNVVIDLHQYGWSSYFGAHRRGIPAWFYTSVEPGRYPANGRGLDAAVRAFYRDPRAIGLYAGVAKMLAAGFGTAANVVGYEVLNEPPGLSTHAGTQAVLSFEAQIAQAFHAADPARTVFVMTRTGGDLGLMDASFAAFGSLRHVALDYHAYYSGAAGTGLTFDGESWTPSWGRTHTLASTRYHGTTARQARMMSLVVERANDLRIPVLVGEWGALRNDVHLLTYQSQMLAVFHRFGLSWARWGMSATDTVGILGSGLQPTAAFAQLAAALRRPSPPPPPPGPASPWFAASRHTLALATAFSHPIWLCYRPAATAAGAAIHIRSATGASLRTIPLGTLPAGKLGCARWRGGTTSGAPARTGAAYARLRVVYADGVRTSVWARIVVTS